MKLNREILRKTEYKQTETYFISMHNAYSAMFVYRALVRYYLEMKEDNFRKIIEGTMDIPENERHYYPPGDLLRVNETDISLRFLIELQAKNFFIEAHNFFDYMAHIIVAFFCGNIEFRLIDFSAIDKKKSEIQQPDVKELIEYISNFATYSYIRDFSNTVKHNRGIGVTIYTNNETLSMNATVQAFSKRINSRVNSYPECDLEQKMKEVHSFTNGVFERFYRLLKPIVKDLITE